MVAITSERNAKTNVPAKMAPRATRMMAPASAQPGGPAKTAMKCVRMDGTVQIAPKNACVKMDRTATGRLECAFALLGSLDLCKYSEVHLYRARVCLFSGFQPDKNADQLCMRF